MQDRIPAPGKEGRVLITPENDSAPFYAKVEMSDSPTQEGTPLNKATLLSDETVEMTASPMIEKISSTLSASDMMLNVTYGSGKFIAAVMSVPPLFYSDDGQTWVTCIGIPSSANATALATNGTRTIVGTDNAIYYTDDGINWTAAAALPVSATQFSAMCYGNGKFVAAAYNGIMLYSEDGVNWYQATGSGFPTSFQSIAYGAGMFIAVSSANNLYFYSTDGVNWASRSFPTIKSSASIAFTNGMFICMNYNSTLVLKSTDGIDWVSVSIPYSVDLTYVLAFGNQFFLYGEESALITNDGTDWRTVKYLLTLNTPYAAYGNNGILLFNSSGNNVLQFISFPSSDIDTPDKMFQHLIGWIIDIENSGTRVARLEDAIATGLNLYEGDLGNG